ncbi:MAG: SDR family oxidoreductase [bacterium]|nr:SDR family oxidoreductase [bacterium]
MDARKKTVFITGCSSGIGRELARRLAERGYAVVATARKPESLQDLIEEARAKNWKLVTAACDVTDEASCVAALMAAREAFGEIHILVNNAGYGVAGPLEAVSDEYAKAQFETNVFGAMRLVRMVVPDMRRAGWGRIVNVSSILGKTAAPYNGWYSASKFALEALSDTMRLELARFGIRTISILPGPVKTAFVENVLLPDLPLPLVPVYEKTVARMRGERSARRKFEVSAERAARVILRAVEAKNPHPRYCVTIPAHVASCLRRVLSDRLMDRVIAKFYRLNRAGRSDSAPGVS